MRILIKVYNTTTGERAFEATAPDINSAIAELGSIERAMDHYKCLWCGEPTQEHAFCSAECGEAHAQDLQLNALKDENENINL